MWTPQREVELPSFSHLMRGRGWAQAARVPGRLQRYSGCESGKKREKGKRDVELGQEGEVEEEGKETGWKRSPRGRGVGRQEGCRDGDGMVGREDQGVRRKGSQAREEKDWAGGGRAQGTKNLEEGIGGRESDHDRVVAGMASRLPRTTRDRKAASGGKKIQIQETVHSGL